MFNFPYDTQTCSLDFGNVVEPAKVVNITTDMNAVDMQSFSPSGEFHVSSSKLERISYEVRIYRVLSIWLFAGSFTRLTYAWDLLDNTHHFNKDWFWSFTQ